MNTSIQCPQHDISTQSSTQSSHSLHHSHQHATNTMSGVHPDINTNYQQYRHLNTKSSTYINTVINNSSTHQYINTTHINTSKQVINPSTQSSTRHQHVINTTSTHIHISTRKKKRMLVFLDMGKKIDVWYIYFLCFFSHCPQHLFFFIGKTSVFSPIMLLFLKFHCFLRPHVFLLLAHLIGCMLRSTEEKNRYLPGASCRECFEVVELSPPEKCLSGREMTSFRVFFKLWAEQILRAQMTCQTVHLFLEWTRLQLAEKTFFWQNFHFSVFFKFCAGCVCACVEGSGGIQIEDSNRNSHPKFFKKTGFKSKIQIETHTQNSSRKLTTVKGKLKLWVEDRDLPVDRSVSVFKKESVGHGCHRLDLFSI